MNLEHIQLFTRVAATHNISQAGQELGLSPAVASNYLNKLEQHLNVRLLHRSTRNVALTEEGRAFLPHAEDLLASAEAARASVGAGTTSPVGTLRVTAPASFGRMHLVPHLKGFMDRYNNLKLDLRLSDSIVDMVEGGFDIAIRNAALKDSNLIARKLAVDKRVLCASPKYLAEFGAPASIDELHQHECLTLMGLDTWSFETAQGIKRIKIKARFNTDNGEALRDACNEGLGITINSTWSVYQHLNSGKLQTILCDTPLQANTAIWAVYPSSRQLAPKVRAFIDYFADVFSEIPYWDKAPTQTVNN